MCMCLYEYTTCVRVENIVCCAPEARQGPVGVQCKGNIILKRNRRSEDHV